MVGQVIEGLKKELSKIDLNYEIVVVNDGSTDKSRAILEKIPEIKLINHPYNKGNGAALKTGANNSSYDLMLFFDADGQHKPEYIKELLKYSDDYDMINGARIKGYKGPIIRQPGKKFLHFLANYLSEQKIPDFNCGMRIIKKRVFFRFLHLLPNSFSLYTTITLALIKEGLNVKFVPIEINKRITGKSTVKSRDAFKSFLLILRTIVLFSPLKVFLPISLILFLGSVITGIYDIFYIANITDITILLFISSILIFFFGLLADQLSAIRREINDK